VNRSEALSVTRGEAPSVGELVGELTSRLDLAGMPGARETAREIVELVAGLPRYGSVATPDARFEAHVIGAARHAAQRLLAGAPFAYAIGSTQFRTLNLRVDERALIPRPETEVLVDEILKRFRAANSPGTYWGTAVDVGTGSGAIALSVAAEGRFARVVATDCSLDALDLARINAAASAQMLRCPIEFRAGSLLAPVRDVTARLLVSNPPYVAYHEALDLPSSVRDWEPPAALLSGANGLAVTAAIVQNGTPLLEHGGLLALEVDERRASLVAELVMSNRGYTDVGVVLDLTGRERFVFATRA
jgi:release factor glutamine methyltransferase